MEQLAAADARDHVGHAVVVADVGMLEPRHGLPRLRREIQGLLPRGLVRRHKHAAARRRDDLVAVEADGVVQPERPARAAMVRRRQRLRRVLYQDGVVLLTHIKQFVHLAGRAVQMGVHDDARLRIFLERELQSLRIHVPAVALRVDEDLLPAFITDGERRRAVCRIAAEDGLARLYARQFQREMESRRSGNQRQRTVSRRRPAVQRGVDLRLQAVNVLPDRRQPVRVERLLDELHFLPMRIRA